MRLCLYNGNKKKKATSKKAKKNTGAAKLVNKKSNNAGKKKEPAKPKKTDRKKSSPEPVEVAVDPPDTASKLTLAQCNETNEKGANEFWEFVDSYTTMITTEDLSYLKSLTEMYSKENFPSMNLMPSSNSHVSNSFSTLDIPDNWVERIVGALVDPDLFPSDDDGDPEAKHMRTEEVDTKRMKLNDPLEPILSVFNDRSNFTSYLDIEEVEDEEEDVNCDNKSSQEEGDEISDEILKCQEELRLLCRQNERAITQLSSRAQRQLDTQQLRESLELCENELVILTQQKHKEQRLGKETVTSSTRQSINSLDSNKEEEIMLLQRCESILTDLEKSQV